MNDKYSPPDKIAESTEYRIIGIVGRRGAGKTLYAVKLAYDYHLLGKTIYSNIHLAFPYKTITPDMLLKLPTEMNNSVIIIDEVQAWADAYDFLSRHSRALANLAQQLRKRKIHLIFTTQFFRQAVKRLRDQTDYIITMEKYFTSGTAITTVYDATALEGEDLVVKFVFNGRAYFGMYDTNEVVAK